MLFSNAIACQRTANSFIDLCLAFNATRQWLFNWIDAFAIRCIELTKENTVHCANSEQHQNDSHKCIIRIPSFCRIKFVAIVFVTQQANDNRHKNEWIHCEGFSKVVNWWSICFAMNIFYSVAGKKTGKIMLLFNQNECKKKLLSNFGSSKIPSYFCNGLMHNQINISNIFTDTFKLSGFIQQKFHFDL